MKKTTKKKTQKNDLTLEIKSGLKYIRIKSRTNSRCLLKGLSCVSTESIYQHIWKDKIYLSLRTTGKRYKEKKNSEVS
jgi:hypothetical protein